MDVAAFLTDATGIPRIAGDLMLPVDVIYLYNPVYYIEFSAHANAWQNMAGSDGCSVVVETTHS